VSVRYGTSWRGRRPGSRHWISVPVGPLGCALFPVALLFWLGFWGVVGMIWICAEIAVAAASAALVLCQLAERQGRLRDVTTTLLPCWLIGFALRPPPP